MLAHLALLAFVLLLLMVLLKVLLLFRPGLKLTMSEARTVLAADFFDRMHESASYSLLNLAAFKRRPSFPRIDRQLNYFHSERNQPNDPCAKCFPCKEGTKSAAYIDLLELPRVGGLPWRPRAPGLPPPRAPLFADLRYSLTAPLSKRYISVTNAVLHSERVEAGIRKTLRERQEENDPSAVKKLRAQATAYVKEMSATFSMLIARLCGYSLFKILRRVMRRLLVCPAQLELIKRAEQEGLPIVYLPLHKSHLDYILLTWTVWHWDLRLPHIASGDNLNLSGFGWLLRSVGAFFIRRRIDEGSTTDAARGSGKDHIYRAVLHTYMAELLRTNQSIEFFAEGTRTRFGKTLLPKNGLLSVVIECCKDGTIPDAMLVPVSCTYEKILEGSFWRELIGVPKQRESVWGIFKELIKGIGMTNQCGNVRLDFGAPVRLTDYINALEPCIDQGVVARCDSGLLNESPSLSRFSKPYISLGARVYSYAELHPQFDKAGADRAHIRAIGYHAIYESQTLSAISIPSVVTALLLCKYRRGTNLENLAIDAEWLSMEVVDSGHDVMGFKPNETDCTNMVLTAIELLGPELVMTERRSTDSDSGFDDETPYGDCRHRLTYVAPRLAPSQLLQLACFKNGLLSAFALDGVIALAACTLGKGGKRFALTELVDKAMFLCDLLRFEFIFCKPCEDLSQKIESRALNSKESAIGRLLRVVSKDERVESSEDEATPRFYGGSVVTDESHLQPNAVYLMIERKSSAKRVPSKVLRFYANLVAPFVASHLLVLIKLKDLVADSSDMPITERHLVQDMLTCSDNIGSDVLSTVSITGECRNADSYRNALKLLIEKKVVRERDVPNIYLIDPHADFDARIASVVAFL